MTSCPSIWRREDVTACHCMRYLQKRLQQVPLTHIQHNTAETPRPQNHCAFSPPASSIFDTTTTSTAGTPRLCKHRKGIVQKARSFGDVSQVWMAARFPDDNVYTVKYGGHDIIRSAPRCTTTGVTTTANEPQNNLEIWCHRSIILCGSNLDHDTTYGC
jgi:hypothetical protein